MKCRKDTNIFSPTVPYSAWSSCLRRTFIEASSIEWESMGARSLACLAMIKVVSLTPVLGSGLVVCGLCELEKRDKMLVITFAELRKILQMWFSMQLRGYRVD